MSHEIRTPMNAILGMLTLLQRTDLTARQREYTTKTEGAARSLLGLLDDILDFSKVEAGRMTLDPRPFRLDQLLRNLSVILSASVGDKGIEMLFDIDPAVPRSLIGDDLRLQQVLINLAGNAIKFTHHGNVVLRVRLVEVDGGDVVLEFGIRDSGIGIAADHLEQIFRGFSQAEASTSRHYGGTGLGLAISRKLVTLMGGELAVESQPGAGSDFHFHARFGVGETTSSENADNAEGANGLRDLDVLIVDDAPIARELLVKTASSLGWRVEAAASGLRALDRLRARGASDSPFDVVFVDWQMPGLDGWQTCARIRATATTRSPVLIIVSANGREWLDARHDDEQSLIDGFLVKPATASMLHDAVVDAKAARGGAIRPMPRGAPANRRLEGLRLLVVEDNPNNQQVAQELLEDEGAVVSLADTGEAGVAAVAAGDPPFDAVLMDIQMPGMDGYTATRQIRGDPAHAALPIIAMTANAMAADRDACLAAGMNDHVGKPFDIDSLVATLSHHTGRQPTDPVPTRATRPLAQPVLAAAQAAGIDLGLALERLGGHQPIYMRMLRSLLADIDALPARLQAVLPDEGGTRSVTPQHQQAAELLIHTFKGSAATLGLTELAARAADAERGVHDRTDPTTLAQRCDALLADCDRQVSSLQRLLDEWTGHPVAPATSRGPSNPASVDS